MNNLTRNETFGTSASDPKLQREGYVIDVVNRWWACSTILQLFQRSGAFEFAKDKDIPDAIKPFYKGVALKTRKSLNYVRPLDIMDVEKPLRKYKVNSKIAAQFAILLAKRIPGELNSLSDKTIASFMEVLPDNKRNLSVIYILPTDGEGQKTRWGDVYFQGTEYIITDKYFNPIDPVKFMSVMEKIVVDK